MADGGIMSAASSPVGMTTVLTPDQVTSDLERARTAESAEDYVQPEPSDALASHVLTAYDANKSFRAEEIDGMMTEDLRQFSGEYDPAKLADLRRAKDPVIFWNVTGEKCRGAHAWVMDVLNFDNGKPFTLDPTPLPDLPPEAEQAIVEQAVTDVMKYINDGGNVTMSAITRYASRLRDRIDAERTEEAKTRAKRMELVCYDQMVEGRWHDGMESFLGHLVWAPIAYIKGPVMRREKTLKYTLTPLGTMTPKLVGSIRPTFSVPSPFDIYPSRDAVNVEDGELCERLKLSLAELESMKGVQGFQDAAIDKIIAGLGAAGAVNHESANTDPERERLELKGSVSDKRNFTEGVEYWGTVPGRMLKEKGVTKDAMQMPLNDLEAYESNVIVIDKMVVFAAVNPDMIGMRPYAKSSWHKKPGSWFGEGIPRLLRSHQQLINAALRSLCKDMAETVGYQTIYNDLSRLAPGEVITESFHGKIHQFYNPNPSVNNSQKPIDFFQPDSNSATLLSVYNSFKPEADTITGIPAYAYGNDQVAGAGRTLGGLSILMSNAARGIKMVLSRIDKDIYRRVVNKMFHFNMQFSPDESIKGDVIVQVSGALSQIVNEQNSQRLMQFLTSTINPVDGVAIGPKQRAAAWREFVKQLMLPKDKLVKSDEEIDADSEAAQKQQAEEMATQSGAPQGEQ